MHSAFGACIHSLQPCFVRVELARFVGMPQMVVVGLPTKAISEAKERLISVIRMCGIKLPHCRFVFNLHPAGLVKQGLSLDLPMVVVLLRTLGVLKREIQLSDKQVWIGELMLDGSVCTVSGMPIMIEAAGSQGFCEVWCNDSYLRKAGDIQYGIAIRSISKITDLIEPSAITHLRRSLTTTQRGEEKALRTNEVAPTVSQQSDWHILLSQPLLVRLLLIAAAGWHHTLLVGPPGLGKTTVASLLVELLPSLQPIEIAEVIKIRSLSDEKQYISKQRTAVRITPYSTAVEIIGNPKHNSVGVISQAHRGVLFVDELLSMPSKTLELLREPLESGQFLMSDLGTSFPAEFLFVGVSNPCRCGNAFSQYGRCTCTAAMMLNFRRKLDAAFLDRMGLTMYIDYQPNNWQKAIFQPSETGQMIKKLKQVISAVWDIQRLRWGDGRHDGTTKNSTQIMSLGLTNDAQLMLKRAKQSRILSERGCGKLLLVARTIADVDAVSNNKPVTSNMEAVHLAEALQYRTKLFSS